MYRRWKQPKADRSHSIRIIPSMDWKWQHLLLRLAWSTREEKTLLGCGQAQVRNPKSTECPFLSRPCMGYCTWQVIALIIMIQVLCDSGALLLPRPKWYQNQDAKRVTTGDLLNNLRAMLWAKATNLNFSDFVNTQLNTRNHRNELTLNGSIAFYVRNQPNLRPGSMLPDRLRHTNLLYQYHQHF